MKKVKCKNLDVVCCVVVLLMTLLANGRAGIFMIPPDEQNPQKPTLVVLPLPDSVLAWEQAFDDIWYVFVYKQGFGI